MNQINLAKTQTSSSRNNKFSLNKMAGIISSLGLSLMAVQASFISPAIAAQKVIETAQESNISSLVERNGQQQLVAQRNCLTYRVVSSNGLYIYNNDNQIIDVIPYNTIVGVEGMSSDGQWAYVSYSQGSGWAASYYLNCYQF